MLLTLRQTKMAQRVILRIALNWKIEEKEIMTYMDAARYKQDRCPRCGDNGLELTPDGLYIDCLNCDGQGVAIEGPPDFVALGKHRKRNYDICTALDMIKLSIVLDEMVEDGMHPQLARIYKMQGSSLLAALRSENNRTFEE